MENYSRNLENGLMAEGILWTAMAIVLIENIVTLIICFVVNEFIHIAIALVL